MTKAIPHHADALSFMARKPEGGGVDHWQVEGTGKYSTDCELGRALGSEFLDYFGEYTTNGNMTLLGCIVVDMVDKGDVPRGLIIGFMGAISEATAFSASLHHRMKTPDALPFGGASLEGGVA